MYTRDTLYIDGLDAREEYGVIVRGDNYMSLMEMPPLKDVDYNDWQEEDGIEPDLSEPRLDTKEVTLQLATLNRSVGWGDLFHAINDGAYHEFRFSALGDKVFKMRLTSNPNTEGMQDRFGFVALEFADDFPLKDYKYLAPVSDLAVNDKFTLDDKPLTYWGVQVLEGTLDDLKKSPVVKPNLLRNLAIKNGVQYDPKKVTFKAKEGKMYCFMRANSMVELWRNYDAFLYDLTKPGERTLFVDETGEEYPCYYKSCKVTEFRATGRVWFKFTLTLCFFSFRINETDMVLATEDNIVVVTEDGEYMIDLNRRVRTNTEDEENGN